MSNAATKNIDQTAAPAGVVIPSELSAIGELIRVQDNRITDAPLFIVQKKVRDYGFADGYVDDFEWIQDGEGVADEREARILQKMYDRGRTIEGWELVGYRDRWEFVTACFTEQGCQDFIDRDGHNHGETRIYAEGSYRNQEYRAVRDFLKGLQA